MEIGVYCLNVGQGSCVAIIDPLPGKGPGHYQASLIDVGVNGDLLAGWLRSVGVDYIAAIVLTHNDSDHVLGLPALVQKYRRRIGRVLFLIDRTPEEIPHCLDADIWVATGVVRECGRLETPRRYPPGMGATLVQEPQTSYRLHCAFPTMHQTEAVVRGAPAANPGLGSTPNDTSGVVRLARPINARRTRFLFGGDLNYGGWHNMRESGLDLRTDVLVAPHHGAPRGATSTFGPSHLAAATKPKYVLFSVGTSQRHVRSGRAATARHPLPEVVRAFRNHSATVLCTQLTDRCHQAPETVAGRALIPLPSLTHPHELSPSGTACGGTILLTLRDSGHITVTRLGEHTLAVNRLRASSDHPLCRP